MSPVPDIQLVHICVNTSSSSLVLLLSLFLSIAWGRAISEEVVLQWLAATFFAKIGLHPLLSFCFCFLRNCYVLIQISLMLILKLNLLITELLNCLRKLLVNFLLFVFGFMFRMLLTIFRHFGLALVFAMIFAFDFLFACSLLANIVIFKRVIRCIAWIYVAYESTFIFLWSEFHVLQGNYLSMLILCWHFICS